MTPKNVLATVFNDTLAQGICYLWIRWQDEQGYEDFKDYEQAMMEHVRNALPNEQVSLVSGTQEPWGIIFRFGGDCYHLKLNIDMKKKNYWLSVDGGMREK